VPPDVVVLPSAAAVDAIGSLQITLTFPESMDQTSTPDATDFSGKLIDGTVVPMEGIEWLNDTELNINVTYSSAFSNPLNIDFANLSAPLIRLRDGEQYTAWSNLSCPVT